MADTSVPRNSSFNANTQIITILLADGVTPVLVSLSDIDARNWYNVASCINFGTQMGACLVMFLVVLVLTKDSKRRTPIFILNLLSLLTGFLRALLLTLYFPSPWTKMYISYTFDPQFVPRGAYATSVAGSVMPLLMTIAVNLSLILQAHTVCQNMDKAYRHIITAVSVFVFLLAVGFRFAVTVTNSETILGAGIYFSKEWISMGALITETISIWYFTLIFTGKLVYTLYNRRRHGWKQWSGVKILAAMGGCTMIIPSIFAILEYVAVAAFPEAGSLAMTMVALLLPLSALWASMSIDRESAALNFSNLAGSESSHNGGSQGSDRRKMLGSQLSSSTTAQTSRLDYGNEKKGSLAPISPSSINTKIEHVSPRDSTDADLESMGVRVDKSYSIQSRKGSAA